MSVRIANAAGFWGDYPDATRRLLDHGTFDYLQLEYLAEVTMGVLGKLHESDPDRGYATDFTRFVVADHLEELIERNVTVVTNAGGINPEACAREVLRLADEQGVEVDVATVTGDSVRADLDRLQTETGLCNVETDEPFPHELDDVTAAVAYLGAFPVADAISTGADIIITGRIADPALTLGPLVHEYGWTRNDYDRLAAGVVAGHLIECGTQVTGGNFLGDWQSVDFENLGYPIAQVERDGTAVITKPQGTGGTVSTETVAEQLVYEVHDPSAYLTPDVTADFTAPSVEQLRENAVRVTGMEGRAPPEIYKATIHYESGYKLSGSLLYSRPDALAKAREAASILDRRIDMLELDVDETHSEFVGHDAAHGPTAPPQDDHNEVMLRYAARSDDKAALRRLGMEFAPLSMAGPPSVTGLTDGGRPSPQPVIDVWPTTVPDEAATPEVITYD
ncbi:DUF1446 domain-containing protein [Halorussus gelatinilyticus]|uniref:DUF1446 domain-containing protein n=1 Tax=Halorussus gelatinilyticus TaxID=2937524 RepID=A0A8U0IDW8_9EURY|nr:acyclic terpene utilization AtuA family protein [Halorussus gelatinilyticus]UPV98964.1 DUF1446 domain-containing protein [Halorussus gelatinilyticus]